MSDRKVRLKPDTTYLRDWRQRFTEREEWRLTEHFFRAMFDFGFLNELASDSFKRALIAARTVGLSTGPSGVYLEKLFERLGLADAVKAKTRLIPSGGTVSTLLANGEAEIGFQQISELLPVPGIDYVGPLPPGAQSVAAGAGLCGAPRRREQAFRAATLGRDQALAVERHRVDVGLNTRIGHHLLQALVASLS